MDDTLYYKRTIVKERVASNFLQEERPVRIFLPPGYQEIASYPVIYCQDGEQFFNFGRIVTHMNRLIYDENVPPAVIVGVTSTSRRAHPNTLRKGNASAHTAAFSPRSCCRSWKPDTQSVPILPNAF